MIIPRAMAQLASRMAGWFPVVSVTGPRQSGKSTLVREVFPDYEYVNLEDPNLRAVAAEDPVGFIRNRAPHLVVDEAQYVPDLFSMIQVVSDENGTPGQYILSGSQNFLLLKSITQSLAGRVGLLKLLPLSYAELLGGGISSGVDEFMIRGGYPRLYDVDMEADIFFEAYISTYVERDVAGYLDVRDAAAFRTVLRLCASNAGNLINYSNLARDADVGFRTVKSWMSILESSYIVFPLEPWHSNLGKRLTKTPKLYFYDTGLLCHLLGIRTVPQLLSHPMLGAVFENLIVSETAKRYLNRGKNPELYFYRDDSKREIDLLDFTDPNNRLAIEIKSSQTYHGRYGKTLVDVGDMLGVPADGRMVVYRGDVGLQANGFAVITAANYIGQSV